MRRRFTLTLWLAALLVPSVALANGIEGWIADSLAEEILAGVPAHAGEAPRIAIKPFSPDSVSIAPEAANALNASLLSALIAKSDGRHTFVARDALKAVVRDVADLAQPGPDDPVERLLAKARADVLVVGSLRRVRQDVVLSYKAVAVEDGAVLASTRSHRLRLPDAARYLMQRADGLETIRIGDIRYRSETPDTPFASYLRGPDGAAVTWREKVRRQSIPPVLTYATPVRGRPTVAEAQRLLHGLGYDPGPVNGVLGPRTRRAIAAFQRNNGLGPDGRMTRALVASLRRQAR